MDMIRRPAGRIQNLYLFGDSIGKGIVLDECEQRYKVLEDSFLMRLQKKFELQVSNFSKYGANILKGLQIFERQIGRVRADSIVLLEFGNNDCDMPWAEIAAEPEGQFLPQVPRELFMETYRKLIAEARGTGAEIIMINLPPLYARRFFSTVSAKLDREKLLAHMHGDVEMIYRWQEYYNLAVTELARELDCPLIDIRSEFLSRYSYEDYLCADGMHPNERGHELISAKVERELKPLL